MMQEASFVCRAKHKNGESSHESHSKFMGTQYSN